jgi:hypothetical protein
MEWLLMLALGFVSGVLYARRRWRPSRAERAAVRARLRELA